MVICTCATCTVAMCNNQHVRLAMYRWGACVICTAPHWTRATIAVQSSCTVATLQLASTDLAKRGGTVQGVLQPICDPGVKCATCCSPLQKQLFWAKADLLRVLRKGDNPRLEFRACLKSNSMKATAYKNFLQRRSVQIKAK